MEKIIRHIDERYGEYLEDTAIDSTDRKSWRELVNAPMCAEKGEEEVKDPFSQLDRKCLWSAL